MLSCPHQSGESRGSAGAPPALPAWERGCAPAHHDAAAVEVVPRDEGLQCVQEGHAPRDVERKLHRLHLVHHKIWEGGDRGSTNPKPTQGCGWRDPCRPQTHQPPALTGPLVQHVVQGAIGHPVADDNGVGSWRGLASTQHRQHIRVGKDPAKEVRALRTGSGYLHPLIWLLPSPRVSQPLATTLECSWPHRAGRLLPAPYSESCCCPEKVPGWPGQMLVRILGTCWGGFRQVQHSPQFWVFLVEVPALPRRPVPDFQHFDYNVIALPAPLPQLEEQGHRHCEMGAESPAPPVGLWSPTMRREPLELGRSSLPAAGHRTPEQQDRTGHRPSLHRHSTHLS